MYPKHVMSMVRIQNHYFISYIRLPQTFPSNGSISQALQKEDWPLFFTKSMSTVSSYCLDKAGLLLKAHKIFPCSQGHIIIPTPPSSTRFLTSLATLVGFSYIATGSFDLCSRRNLPALVSVNPGINNVTSIGSAFLSQYSLSGWVRVTVGFLDNGGPENRLNARREVVNTRRKAFAAL